MNEINKITGNNYKPFNYYGCDDAKSVIIAMGSVCDTIRETVDYLNSQGGNYGLVEVHLYRPFSNNHLINVIPKTIFFCMSILLCSSIKSSFLVMGAEHLAFYYYFNNSFLS